MVMTGDLMCLASMRWSLVSDLLFIWSLEREGEREGERERERESVRERERGREREGRDNPHSESPSAWCHRWTNQK